MIYILKRPDQGMLTFMLYYLLKNPEAMLKLRDEVDTLIGDRPMTVDDVHKLPYLIGMTYMFKVKLLLNFS